jgi:DNA-binding IscR family transcriptional regulator
MKRDSRLSGVLHLLLHMFAAEKPLTSEELARAMQTNPVVVRRVLADLRETGMVRSEKGHGGGWSLNVDLAAVTLYDVYAAIGAPHPFALGNRTENPSCLVEQAVNAALDEAFKEAEALLLARLRDVSLLTIAEYFRNRLGSRTVTQGDCLYEL